MPPPTTGASSPVNKFSAQGGFIGAAIYNSLYCVPGDKANVLPLIIIEEEPTPESSKVLVKPPGSVACRGISTPPITPSKGSDAPVVNKVNGKNDLSLVVGYNISLLVDWTPSVSVNPSPNSATMVDVPEFSSARRSVVEGAWSLLQGIKDTLSGSQ